MTPTKLRTSPKHRGRTAMVAWEEKERYSSSRPITAIQLGGDGVGADASWAPLIDTPQQPEYPSGHAADCFTGAFVLEALLRPLPAPIRYVGLFGPASDEAAQIWIGQQPRLAGGGRSDR